MVTVVYNGRVKIAIWRFHAETGMRKENFWLLSVIASKTSCIILLLVCFHQFGMLYFFYSTHFELFCGLSWRSQCFSFSHAYGTFLEHYRDKSWDFWLSDHFWFAVAGSMDSKWFVPLASECRRLCFSNPPRFPRKDFLHVKHASIHFRFPMTLFSLDTIRYALQYKWSPFPSECASQTIDQTRTHTRT